MSSPALTASSTGRDNRTQDKRPVRALGGLLPFIRPYRVQIGLAGLFLVLLRWPAYAASTAPSRPSWTTTLTSTTC